MTFFEMLDTGSKKRKNMRKELEKPFNIFVINKKKLFPSKQVS